MIHRLFQVIVLATLSFAAGMPAAAAPVDDISALVKTASRAFAEQNWAEAERALQKAHAQAESAGLASDKLMARVLVYQGAVLVAGANRPSEAVDRFRHAIRIDPGAKLTSTLAKPEVLDAFKRAVIMERAEQAAAAPAPEPAAPAPEPAASAPAEPAASASPAPRPSTASPPETAPTSVAKSSSKKATPDEPREEPDVPAKLPRPLYCPNPDEAPPNRKAVLHCIVQPELDVGRVLFFYRLPGAEEYETLPAQKTPAGWYIVVVPAKAMAGRLFQHYFEARDATDAVIADNGRFDSPNLIILREGAAPVTHDGSAVLDGRSRYVGTGRDDDSEEDPLFRAEENPRDTQGRRYWFSLSIGRGLGFHGTAELEWYAAEVGSGTRSASLLHLWPELGWKLSRRFAVALQGRNQLIRHTGSEPGKEGAPAIGANAALLRLIWLIPFGAFSNVQVSGLAGAGEGFRLVVPPNEVQMRGSSDTIRGGPFLVGLGLHTDIGLGDRWAVRLGVEALRGLPDSATVIDFALGGVYRF